MQLNTLSTLYASLKQRKRPEDVAEMVIAVLGAQLNRPELQMLEKAARGSLSKRFFGYTSMLQEFAPVVGANRQVNTAIERFGLNQPTVTDISPEATEAFIKDVSPIINKQVGKNNNLTDRLNKYQRKALGMDISKRQYNKKWRLLKKLEAKLATFLAETRKLEFQKIAKHGLAHRISREAFMADANTACFIAYYNARCNLRSVFTNQAQARPFDEICNMLLNRCKGVSKNSIWKLGRKGGQPAAALNTNWWAIAHVYTSQETLAKLSEREKGQLLGKWTGILAEIADLLKQLWETSDINQKTMVVRRGNDSSTWNNTAGAWNKARDNWMNLIYSLGMEYLLDEVCFGKVMRLMAADVVAWHSLTGGKLDPNTEVWNSLPLPWEIFEGQGRCTRKTVAKACKVAGLDAEKSGWIAPRPHGIASFKPTPELVHGVAIANPFLASYFKQEKYFSGKPQPVK